MMNVEASLEGHAAGHSAPTVWTIGGSWKVVAFLPKNLKELLGAFPRFLLLPPASSPGMSLPSLTAHQAGQNPTTLQVGRLLPVAETDDIFISLSKPPLFMEVSPG